MNNEDCSRKNIAFIDGQNLYLGTKNKNININLGKFYVYLKERLKIDCVYYFFGYRSDQYQSIYQEITDAGFILVFKEHNKGLLGQKKGNVDTDIVFEIMRNIIDNQELEKIFLISGDGDYKKVVDYLLAKKKFGKVLFPNMQFASSLYKRMGNAYYIDLSRQDVHKHFKK